MQSVPATTFAQLIALLSLLIPASPHAGEMLGSDDDAGDLSAETPPPKHRKRLVYACRDAATPVFSDRPCGASADAWRLDLPTPRASGAAPSTRAAAPAAATRPIMARASHRDAAVPPNPCMRLEAQLATIDARMRGGYSAREAARLWQRWRDAKAKLHAAHC